MRQLSAVAKTPSSLSPYLYVPSKRRWWPLFVCLGAAGIFALALFGSSQQPTGAGSQQRPLAYSVVRPDGSTRTRRPVKPAGAHGPSETTHQLPPVPNNIGGEDTTMPPPETAIAPGGNAVAVPTRGNAMNAPARTKTHVAHLTAKHSKPVQRYAARNSHRQVAANYWRYGGYSWGWYGFNSNRNAGWFPN
jgi:hypothetical protein